MKYTTFAFLLVCFSAIALLASDGKGQSLKDVTISLKLKNKTLDKAFDQIESATEFKFVYNPSEVRSWGLVSMDKKKITVEQALRELLPATLSFQQSGNNILILRKPVAKPAAKRASWTVTGKVIDDQGSEIPGATVRNKTAHTGVIADERGSYRIPVSDETDTLVFSSLGFLSEETVVGTRTVIDMNLVANLEKLDQMVVIGYGMASRRTLTGSVSTINARTLEKQPVNDPMAALQGRVSGLQITNTSGLPGSNVNVQIRGVNSLKGGTSPLYIVDGVPFVSGPLNAESLGSLYSSYLGVTGANSSTVRESPFKSINPSDIESIEVLKDADATAIYGARGANGVILITTKRGKPGKTIVSVDAYTGISQVPKFNKMFTTQQYVSMRKEALRNDKVAPSLDPDDFLGYAPDLLTWDTTAYTNWQKKFTGGTAHNTNIQASLTGGSEQTQFVFTTGYRKQGTVFPGDYGLTQGSFRLNLNHKSRDDKFTSSFHTAYSTDKNDLLAGDPTSFYDLAPNFPLYNRDGSLNWTGLRGNPMAQFLQTMQNKTSNLMGNAVFGYQILPDLQLSTSFGYNQMQLNQERLKPIAANDPKNGSTTGFSEEATSYSKSLTIEPQINYALNIGKGRLAAMVGGTYLETSSSTTWITATGYTDDRMLGNLKFADPQQTLIYTTGLRYRYLSTFSRLTYNLRSRYIVNLTLRRDGSSRFGPNKRYGNFGAIGAAWIFSEEPFIKNNFPLLSFGKLRSSYGVTGNDQIRDYKFYDTWTAAGDVYQTLGAVPTSLYNPDFRWETNKKLEAAMELGFLQDRLSLTVAYYLNRSGNQLIDYTLPSQVGFASVNQNSNALIQNNGVEVDLQATIIKGSAFTWDASLNISLQSNKLIRFPGLDSSAYRTQYAIGKSISNTSGYTFEGIDPETGQQLYKGVNANTQYPDGQSVIANSLPRYYGGFNNSFSYKNLHLDVFFSFKKQDKALYRFANVASAGSLNYNHDQTTLGRWQKPGDKADFPKYTTSPFIDTNTAVYFLYSDRLYYNGSYIRLSNISLSYDLPTTWLKRVKVQQLRFYVLAQNLFIFSNYPGPDPETGDGMPSLRVITTGLKIAL